MRLPKLIHLCCVLALCWLAIGGGAAERLEISPPGYRPAAPPIQALIGARVVVKPGEILNPGTIIIRDGIIAAVGTNLSVPAEAMVQSRTGQTIYAGFIDPYLVTTTKARPVTTTATEPVQHIAENLTSGGVRFLGVAGDELDPGKAGPGHESSRMTPQRRMADEYSPNPELLEQMRELGFTTANIVPDTGILRGTSCFVTLSESNPNETIIKPEVFQHAVFDTGSTDRSYPRSLMGVVAALRQSFMDGDFYQLAQAHYEKNPTGGRRPPFNPAWAALAPSLQRKLPVIMEAGSALMIDRAARLGREFNLSFYLVSSGQEWRRPEFVPRAATAFIVPINFPELPKLPEESDWHQVTLDQLRAWDWAPENPALLQRAGADIALTTFGLPEKKQFRKKLRLACDRGLSESNALAALTVIPAQLCGLSAQLGTIEPGKLANFTVVQGDNYFDQKNKVTEVWIEGRLFPVKGGAKKTAEAKPTEAKASPAAADTEDKTPNTLKLDETSRVLRSQRVARAPAEDRPSAQAPKAVLIRGATIWTCGPAGVIQQGDLLVVEGTIRTCDTNLYLPENFSGAIVVMDGRGWHVTPGLIDAHSHSMILGGVNEGSLPSSAMVRVGDVINSETANISRQLAGGLTIANLLHGSANPIGGQNAIIKLRDGRAPEDLKLTNAPLGIKFALGENVKQSNVDTQPATRFPQTRMGVKTFFANRFGAARQYMSRQKEGNPAEPPLRKDLELETLAEILRGERWIHCHSYRQDEIIAFLRTMEGFGVRVGTLQHVLEGYKVADEIARHGAGASCFSDWWGYKFEVYDAIPYAGSLMRERGVLVSFNSDSSDLARRLNLEATKAVKYGNTPEEDALHFVTINPARQLRIETRVGSLEPGKDADFVIWSGSPLDSGSVCLQTWIDGRKYFDRAQTGKRGEALVQERIALRDKARKILQQPDASGGAGAADGAGFFKLSLEHEFDHIERHCLDDE